MATLINGDGNPAVYAVQDADWYIGLLGGQTRILNRGLKFAYHVEDINTFLMDDGLILTKEGRRIQLDANAQDEITIPNGVQGSTQYYIVGYHLYTDASANQLCEVFIQQMDNATDTIEEKTFISGETEVYISLYRITQTELVVSNVQLLLPIDTTQAEDRASLALSLSDLRSSFMGADTALSNRITANTNNIANIRGIISTVEEGDTATAAYSSGDFVQYTTGGTTYFANVVSSIAIGDTFVNGTNVENTTIADNVGGIDRTPLTPPTVSGSYTYDGTEKTVVWSGLDTTKVEIQGTQSATNAGTYTCTAVLKDSYNYCWTDGTNAPIEATWTIAKATDTPTTSSTNVYTGDGVQTIVNVSSITGIQDAVSSDTSKVTTSVNWNTITLTGGSTPGATTVIVTTNGNQNYNSGTLTLNVQNTDILIVSWANGTDSQIAAMVAALDSGDLTISQTGWSVGDEREVSLSAMQATGVSEAHDAETVTMVILDTDHYDLTNATSGGKTKSSFVIGLKNTLSVKGYMNSTNTNSGSWSSSARRTWCNDVFKNAIPSTLRSCFKQFKVPTADEWNGSSLTTTDDYFALAAEKEVATTRYASTQTEWNSLSQLAYYTASSNRIKKLGDGGAPTWYWERSPFNINGTSFGAIDTSGASSNPQAGASGLFGIAPFGVI